VNWKLGMAPKGSPSKRQPHQFVAKPSDDNIATLHIEATAETATKRATTTIPRRLKLQDCSKSHGTVATGELCWTH
jgi:hypothetical protein